jgi:hypothetical protein
LVRDTYDYGGNERERVLPSRRALVPDQFGKTRMIYLYIYININFTSRFISVPLETKQPENKNKTAPRSILVRFWTKHALGNDARTCAFPSRFHWYQVATIQHGTPVHRCLSSTVHPACARSLALSPLALSGASGRPPPRPSVRCPGVASSAPPSGLRRPPRRRAPTRYAHPLFFVCFRAEPSTRTLT